MILSIHYILYIHTYDIILISIKTLGKLIKIVFDVYRQVQLSFQTQFIG